jgi:hypothetical protein
MSDVRWAVRVGVRWLGESGIYKEKDARATFSDRLFAIQAQSCVNHHDSRIVKITRKPKAKVMRREVFQGVMGGDLSLREHGRETADLRFILNDRFMSKRVRVTIEVLES